MTVSRQSQEDFNESCWSHLHHFSHLALFTLEYHHLGLIHDLALSLLSICLHCLPGIALSSDVEVEAYCVEDDAAESALLQD